mgnify:FL=1
MEKKLKNAIIMNRLTKIMFVLGFLLTSVWSYLSNSVYAQNQKFSFEFKQTSIKTIFQYIEKHSEFIFMYRTDLLDTSKKVSVKVEKQSIEQILEQVLKGTSVVYEINDRQIVLKKRTDERKVIPQQSGQKRLIQGFVKDEKGEVIIGATIKVKNTEIGTATNMDGLYNLTVPSESSVLVVSYIGYVTQEVTVGKRQNIIIVLKEDAKSLEEVVITAYGTGQKKASMVGSVQTVRPADLKVPAANLSTSFAGRLSGVIAVQRSGEPGADGANFWIRGVSTLGSASTSPLIIIDGIEASATDLNALDPEVIDGFSILKDATATAMYGMRGANGVMIVTTKSGAALDKPIINFRVEGSMSEPTSIPKFVDGVTFMQLYNEAVYNQPSGKEPYTQERINGVRDGLNPYVFPNVDWYNEMFKDRSFSEMFNFNIRGGGKKVDYFSSVSVSHESGMLKSRSKDFFSFDNNISRMRYSFQNNINARLGKYSRLSLKLNVMLVDKRGPAQSTSELFNSVMNTNPVDAPIMFPEDGETTYIKWGAAQKSTVNPLASMVNGYSDVFQSTVIASLNFDQDLSMFVPGLKFKAMASLKNFSNSVQTRSAGWNVFSMNNWVCNEDGTYDFDLTREKPEESTELKTSSSNTGDRRIYLQAMLEYNRTFGKHDVGGLLIYNQDEYVNNNPGTDLLKTLPTRRQGIAARASYAYDNKYLMEVNLGYNGSENFSKGNRWGLFPSIALGYNISEETFFTPLKDVVTRMKIRASYGLVGNGEVGGQRFAYLSNVDLTGSPSFTTGIDMNTTLSGPSYRRFTNNELTWEVGKKYNFGIDLMLLNRFNLTFDVFREDRSNIFQTKATIPSYTGVYGTAAYVNSAKVRNQGVDASIDFGHKFNKDFSMTFKGTFTYAHNEILKYEEAIGDYPALSRIGYSTSQQWGYIADHLFADNKEVVNNPSQMLGGTVEAGDIKYINQPNKYGKYDAVIDQNDRLPIGNPTTPEIVYGFGPSLQWKGFDFSFFFQGVAKTSLFMRNLQPFGKITENKNVQTFIANDHWSPDNQNIFAAYPRLTIDPIANNSAQSTFWMRDGAFLKLKNAEIGYTYKNMRFYLRGSNLLTISKFDLWDPEQGGGNGLKYPTQRVFNLGFQMTIK